MARLGTSCALALGWAAVVVSPALVLADGWPDNSLPVSEGRDYAVVLEVANRDVRDMSKVPVSSAANTGSQFEEIVSEPSTILLLGFALFTFGTWMRRPGIKKPR